MAGGGGADDHSSSVFRVGDNVELVRVLGMVSVLVLCVMVLEHFLHRLEHHLHRYPKYQEMMTKVFGELMILGLIGLGIKILKELAHLDPYSQAMIAFQAADITVFLVAIALIVQAVVVFLRMRRKNIQVDKAELISTRHLVDHITRTGMPAWFHELAAIFTYARSQDRKRLTRADIPEVAQVRILRHYFLRSYGLPELFPFSKYLRQAQDNQISHMIEVEISTWVILLLIAWALEAASKAIEVQWSENYAIVIAFLIFSWLSVLLHIAITAYFTWAIDELLNAAVDAPSCRSNRYVYLEEIAEHEAQAADRELAADAIAVMERVREREQVNHATHERNALSRHDTGFQLVSMVLRKVSSKEMNAQQEEASADAEQQQQKPPGTVDADGEPTPPRGQTIQLRWFSRKAWHFAIMATLMLNAFYVALFCQCVIYQMRSIYDKFGAAPTLSIPVPLMINALVFQPRILRNFILVSSILRVDDTALGEVIDHFTETVQLRAGFVQCVHTYLESTNQSVDDIRIEFECRDPKTSGFLNAEEVRLVLRRFGFKLSYFRFNSVAKLLFDLHGITIKYSQVLKLLEIGRSDDVRALTNTSELYTGESADMGNVSSSFLALESLRTPPGSSSSAPGVVKQRSNKALVRAKSSEASSLYRIDFGDDQRSHHGGQSPSSTEYVRM